MGIVQEEIVDADKLQVSFYFFVIKADKINNEKFGFEVKYFNKNIGVISLMSGSDSDNFHSLLLNIGLKRGIDFVDGLNDGLTGLEYYPNDWLKFETINYTDYVSFIENN